MLAPAQVDLVAGHGRGDGRVDEQAMLVDHRHLERQVYHQVLPLTHHLDEPRLAGQPTGPQVEEELRQPQDAGFRVRAERPGLRLGTLRGVVQQAVPLAHQLKRRERPCCNQPRRRHQVQRGKDLAQALQRLAVSGGRAFWHQMVIAAQRRIDIDSRLVEVSEPDKQHAL
ncbi:hypothetical protein D3C72_1850520 [compost metagenome]